MGPGDVIDKICKESHARLEPVALHEMTLKGYDNYLPFRTSQAPAAQCKCFV